MISAQVNDGNYNPIKIKIHNVSCYGSVLKSHSCDNCNGTLQSEVFIYTVKDSYSTVSEWSFQGTKKVTLIRYYIASISLNTP